MRTKKKKKYTKSKLKLALEFIAFSESRAPRVNSEHKDSHDAVVNTAYSFAFGLYVCTLVPTRLPKSQDAYARLR